MRLGQGLADRGNAPDLHPREPLDARRELFQVVAVLRPQPGDALLLVLHPGPEHDRDGNATMRLLDDTGDFRAAQSGDQAAYLQQVFLPVDG